MGVTWVEDDALTAEADPVFLASPSHGITTTKVSNWDTAYSWGNHAVAGYSLNSSVVHVSSDETIGGVKTFTSPIVGSVTGNAASITGSITQSQVTGLTGALNSKAPLRVFDVKSYGAVGDGVTDDSTAINAAITAASSVVPAILQIPPASYRITQSLRPEADDLTILAYGATLKLDANVEAILVNKGVYPLTPVNRLRIRGLRIDASSGHGVDSAGLVQLNNAIDFIISDCVIDGPGSALADGFAFSQGSRGELINCVVNGVNKSGFYQSSQSGYIVFGQCKALNIRGTVGAAGYTVGRGGCSLVGCEASNCLGPGVALMTVGASGPAPAEESRDVSIIGGRFSGCLHGISVSSGISPKPRTISILGSILTGNSQWGVDLEDGTRITLDGVHCSKNGFGGIYVGPTTTRVAIGGGFCAENGSNTVQGVGVYVSGQYVSIDSVHFFDEQTTPTQLNGVIVTPTANHLTIRLPRMVPIANPIRYESTPNVTDGQFEWTEPTYDPPGLIPAPIGSRVNVLASGKFWKKTSGSDASGWVEETDASRALPVGGTINQILAKASGTDYDTHWVDPGAGGGGSGTVTSVSVASANGFGGSVATATTTPAITITTSVTGILKGNGTAVAAAVSGTDYVVPSGSITGTAANVTGTVALANGGTNANLSATGGTGQYLRQVTSGAAVTVGTIPAADVPNLDAAKITTGVPAGVLKGAAGVFAAAIAGTDFLTPTGSGAGLTAVPQLVSRVFLLAQGVDAVAAQTTNPIRVKRAHTLVSAHAICVTAPSSPGLTLTIEKSTNGGTTWTDLWAGTTANRPTIAAGSTDGTDAGAFDSTTGAAGTWYRGKVVTAGSTTAGQTITLELEYTLTYP